MLHHPQLFVPILPNVIDTADTLDGVPIGHFGVVGVGASSGAEGAAGAAQVMQRPARDAAELVKFGFELGEAGDGRFAVRGEDEGRSVPMAGISRKRSAAAIDSGNRKSRFDL